MLFISIEKTYQEHLYVFKWVESKKRFERLLLFYSLFFFTHSPFSQIIVVSLKYMIISFQCVLSRDSFLDWEIAFYDVTYNFVLKLISVHGKVMNGILSPYLVESPW